MSKKFSVAEVAEAVDALYKAGVTSEQVVDGALIGSLSLAAAGDLSALEGVDLATAALVRFQIGRPSKFKCDRYGAAEEGMSR